MRILAFGHRSVPDPCNPGGVAASHVQLPCGDVLHAFPRPRRERANCEVAAGRHAWIALGSVDRELLGGCNRSPGALSLKCRCTAAIRRIRSGSTGRPLRTFGVDTADCNCEGLPWQKAAAGRSTLSMIVSIVLTGLHGNWRGRGSCQVVSIVPLCSNSIPRGLFGGKLEPRLRLP